MWIEFIRDYDKRSEVVGRRWVEYRAKKKPRYVVHMGKPDAKYDDAISNHSFSDYRGACEFIRYMYGGEETAAVREMFERIEEEDNDGVGEWHRRV